MITTAVSYWPTTYLALVPVCRLAFPSPSPVLLSTSAVVEWSASPVTCSSCEKSGRASAGYHRICDGLVARPVGLVRYHPRDRQRSHEPVSTEKSLNSLNASSSLPPSPSPA